VAQAPVNTRALAYVLVGGAVVAALAWIDPLFVPLVLVGPLLHGSIEGWRATSWLWVAGVWLVGGLLMTISDLIVNQEDVVFHLVLGVVTALIALGAWAAANALARRVEGGSTGTAGRAP
jgi:hypothetical protein